MKPTLLTCALFLFTGTVVQAQFSLLPQLGFERSGTALNYGEGLKACDINGNLKAVLQAGYQFKGGHTPFLRIGTSPAPVSFSFDNAGTLISRTQVGGLLPRFEAGYQYSSKPISLGKKRPANAPAAEATQTTVVQRSSCGSVIYKSSCGSKRKAPKVSSPGNLNMRIQPSLALAYVPSNTEGVVQTANGFNYRAAPWTTAIVPAMGFEFAKGAKRLFTLTAFYTRPLQQSAETITSGTGIKAVSVPLQSRASTWGMTVGVPFGFAKAAQPKVQKAKKECIRSYNRTYRRCTRF